MPWCSTRHPSLKTRPVPVPHLSWAPAEPTGFPLLCRGAGATAPHCPGTTRPSRAPGGERPQGLRWQGCPWSTERPGLRCQGPRPHGLPRAQGAGHRASRLLWTGAGVSNAQRTACPGVLRGDPAQLPAGRRQSWGSEDPDRTSVLRAGAGGASRYHLFASGPSSPGSRPALARGCAHRGLGLRCLCLHRGGAAEGLLSAAGGGSRPWDGQIRH